MVFAISEFGSIAFWIEANRENLVLRFRDLVQPRFGLNQIGKPFSGFGSTVNQKILCDSTVWASTRIAKYGLFSDG